MPFWSQWFKKVDKVGLALSGGATHGAAHVGVLRVLEREGIRPYCIAGTSAGAIVGAAYAAGMPLDEIAGLFTRTNWTALVRPSLFRKTGGLFDTAPLEGMIRTMLGDQNIEALPIPFAAVACDIMTGERVVLRNGPLAPAVRASAAFPGLFNPVHLNGRVLVDGGVVDNLPADVAREMGAEYVIAVDLSSPTTLKSAPETAVDVLWAVSNLLQARASYPDLDSMQVRICPDVDEFSSWSFEDVEEMEARGRAAAETVVPRLRKDLRRVE